MPDPKRIPAVSIDRASGRSTKIEATVRPKAMSTDALGDALSAVHTMDGEMTFTEHVRLSAQVPWVADRGYLNAIHARAFWSDGPNMSWIHEPGQIQGRLEVWLQNLEPNAMYVAQIEISTPGTGVVDVSATNLGAGKEEWAIGAQGAAQTILVMFGTADGGLGLMHVTAPNWIFYEIVVSKVD